ncbi:hypothetical protein CRG98_044127 [Punica granatum]|uniref:Uncharacterized protein n=1 Tax=Punica granatum TaxID=22663 RepID=A0A2I0HUV1_PUNGR|nr:hypothetical protein CRG98_044127 [Punica granatum]
MPLTTLPGLLTRVSLLSCTVSSSSHLARATCHLAGSAIPCELTFLHRKFVELPRSCLLQCRKESKLARVSGPGKVARGTNEVARETCDPRKKVSSHGLADPARLQEERTRWLGELAMQESCKRHERGGSAHLRCKKWNSLGLADLARLQEARARWLGELAVRESKLIRVSKPGMVAKGMSAVARRTCGAGKHECGGSANLRCRKVNSDRLADPARLQEARARWLGELAV